MVLTIDGVECPVEWTSSASFIWVKNIQHRCAYVLHLSVASESRRKDCKGNYSQSRVQCQARNSSNVHFW